MPSSGAPSGDQKALHAAVVLLSAGFTGVLCLALGASPLVGVALGLLVGGTALTAFRFSHAEAPGRSGGPNPVSERGKLVPKWEAELLAQRGAYEEAIQAYELLLAENPDHVELLAAVAELRFARLSDFGGAARDWAEALRRLPQVSEGHRRSLEGEGLPNYWKLRLEDCRRKMGRSQKPGLDSVELPSSKGRF